MSIDEEYRSDWLSLFNDDVTRSQIDEAIEREGGDSELVDHLFNTTCWVSEYMSEWLRKINRRYLEKEGEAD